MKNPNQSEQIPEQSAEQLKQDLLNKARANDPFDASAFTVEAIAAHKEIQQIAIEENGDYKRLMRQWIKRHPRVTGQDTIPHFSAKYFD